MNVSNPRAAALRDAAEAARTNYGDLLPYDDLSVLVTWLEQRAAREDQRVTPAAELSCVLCIYDPCEPPDPDPAHDDPPHDGRAVYIVGGTSVCDCHLTIMVPDDLAPFLKALGERTRERNIEKGR